MCESKVPERRWFDPQTGIFLFQCYFCNFNIFHVFFLMQPHKLRVIMTILSIFAAVSGKLTRTFSFDDNSR